MPGGMEAQGGLRRMSQTRVPGPVISPVFQAGPASMSCSNCEQLQAGAVGNPGQHRTAGGPRPGRMSKRSQSPSSWPVSARCLPASCRSRLQVVGDLLGLLVGQFFQFHGGVTGLVDEALPAPGRVLSSASSIGGLDPHHHVVIGGSSFSRVVLSSSSVISCRFPVLYSY